MCCTLKSHLFLFLSVFQEMQARLDQIRNELADQRERDGGVFMSQEKKDEMEKKMLELEQLRKEYIDLTVRRKKRRPSSLVTQPCTCPS